MNILPILDIPAWAQIDWAQPWGLLLALQPLLMSVLLRMRRKRVLHYADAHLRAWAIRERNGGRNNGSWHSTANYVAWLLLALALAGPRLPLPGDIEQGTPRREMDVMLLLDVSTSMLAQDIAPQRLQRAKLELLDLLPQLRGERVGLIAFSGSAGLLMPLNRDAAALRYYLNFAEPALFSAQGTALASALDLAQRNLPQDAAAAKAILLLTDADGTALSGPSGSAVWEAADRLRQANIPVFILGLASEQGSTIMLPQGNTLVHEGEDVISLPDAAGFTELAKQTAGKFVQVTDGNADWQALYNDGLLTLPQGQPTTERVQQWRELFAYFLLPALLLLLLPYIEIKFNIINNLKLFVVIVLAAGAAQIEDARAGESKPSEAEAYALYQQQNYVRAQSLYAGVQGYAARMGEGAAAYRRKDYLYAIKQYASALLQAGTDKQREQALFNLGNSYYLAGNYRAAADAFKGVLQYAADNADARANLALSAGKLAAERKADAPGKGILGRRGRDTGGRMGEDASDSPLAMEEGDDKSTVPGIGSELQHSERARLLVAEQASASTAQTESDARYQAALKKLEMTEDKPLLLHQSLIRIEAAREYVPQPEMVPW